MTDLTQHLPSKLAGGGSTDLGPITQRVTLTEGRIAALEAGGSNNGGGVGNSNVNADGGVVSGGVWYSVGKDANGDHRLWWSLDRVSWTKSGAVIPVASLTYTSRQMGAVGDTVIIGNNDGVIVRSLDRGETWETLPAGLGNPDNNGTIDITTVINDGDKTWFIAFDDGHASMSTDKGDTWTHLPRHLNTPSVATADILDVATNNSGTWVVVYTDYLSVSRDNGATWTSQSTVITGRTVVWLGGENWVLAGDNMTQLARSSDDAVSWTSVDNDKVGGADRAANSVYRAVSDGKGRCLIIAAGGGYLMTKDHGNTWHNSVNYLGISNVGAPTSAATDYNGTWLVEVGDGVIGSVDNMASWHYVACNEIVGQIGLIAYGKGTVAEPVELPEGTTGYVLADFTNTQGGVTTSVDNAEEVVTVAGQNDYTAINIGLHDNFRIEIEGRINASESIADLAVVRNSAGEGVKARLESRGQYTSGFVDGQTGFGSQDGGSGNGSVYHVANIWLSVKIEMINGTLTMYVEDTEIAQLTPTNAGADYTWLGLGVGSWKRLRVTNLSDTSSGGDSTPLAPGSQTQTVGTVETITEGNDDIVRISTRGGVAVWDLGLHDNFFVEVESRVPTGVATAEYEFYRTSAGRGELARLGVSIPHGDGFLDAIQGTWGDGQGSSGQATVDVDPDTWYTVRMEKTGGEIIFYINGTERHRRAPLETGDDRTFFGLGWGDHRNLRYGQIEVPTGDGTFTEADYGQWTLSNANVFDSGGGVNGVSVVSAGNGRFDIGLHDNFVVEAEVQITSSVADIMFARNDAGDGQYLRVSADSNYPSGFGDVMTTGWTSWTPSVATTAHGNPTKTFASNTWIPIRIEVANGKMKAFINGSEYTVSDFTAQAGFSYIGITNQGAIRKVRWATYTPPAGGGNSVATGIAFDPSSPNGENELIDATDGTDTMVAYTGTLTEDIAVVEIEAIEAIPNSSSNELWLGLRDSTVRGPNDTWLMPEDVTFIGDGRIFKGSNAVGNEPSWYSATTIAYVFDFTARTAKLYKDGILANTFDMSGGTFDGIMNNRANAMLVFWRRSLSWKIRTDSANFTYSYPELGN